MNLTKTKEFKEILEKSQIDKNIIGLVLFGSYAKNKQKPTSDLDLCVIRKKNTMPHDFEVLSYKDEKLDILFFDLLPDYIKFNIFKEGKILVINDKKSFFTIRRRFIHKYLDEFPYFERNLNKVIANV